MRRVSILSMLVAIACVVGATFASAGANATENKAEWAVNKGGGILEALKTGEAEALSEAITTKTNWVIKQTTGAGITVECSSVSFFGGESKIIARKETTFEPLLFEGCVVTAPTGDTECEVESTGAANGEVRTELLGFNALEGLEGPTASPHVRFVPESSREEIVTIQLKKSGGKPCTNTGSSLEVAGILVAKIDSSKAAKTHKWEFGKNTGTRLTVGGVEATFTGAGEFKLKSGKEWGDI
jgi:hypothetical protein